MIRPKLADSAVVLVLILSSAISYLPYFGFGRNGKISFGRTLYLCPILNWTWSGIFILKREANAESFYLIRHFAVDEGAVDEGPVVHVGPAAGEEHPLRVQNDCTTAAHGQRKGLQSAEAGSVPSLVDRILGQDLRTVILGLGFWDWS